MAGGICYQVPNRGNDRLSMVRGSPFGSDAWRRQAARRLGIESTLRPADARGRKK